VIPTNPGTTTLELFVLFLLAKNDGELIGTELLTDVVVLGVSAIFEATLLADVLALALLAFFRVFLGIV
jgi:hypothetical protein